jgi:N-acetylglucosamine kinase-like BadF-type ATPase
MAGRRFLLGIDGGGTKTTALLADQEGRVLGRGVAGASNYQNIGVAAAQAALESAIMAAFVDAALPPAPIAAVCLGLAGVDRPEDHSLFHAWAVGRFSGTRIVIVNDAGPVLAAGTPDGWGVALICGTGSIVYGRSPTGADPSGFRNPKGLCGRFSGQALARAGGWGHLLGDEGSGYAIGLAGLRAVLRAYDGRGPQTALTRTILAHWELSTPPELVGRVYREHLQPADIAGLAAVVDEAAAGDDEVARVILQEAGRELALAVSAVVRRLGLQGPIPCALAGGVIVKGQVVREMFLSAARRSGLQLAPVISVTEPALGALRLARATITISSTLSETQP